METERFNTPEQVIAVAKKKWRKIFPKGEILIEGSYAIAEPQKVLVGPREVKAAINRLVQEIEAIERKANQRSKTSLRIGPWEADPKAMKRICREWDALMEKYDRQTDS